MEIVLKDPRNDAELRLTVEPEDYNGEQGVRIVYPNKDSFVMVQKNGDWEVMDEDFVNPELVDAIGKALHPRASYNSI
ncbi:hypothetical protein [Telluribacter sp. SYSU D00476]|uniref:hypothetical protein n=1 Tax=Telluribacter sp. SYSU D00476 TaxID=2811430 RepID=UPI001FF65CB6|nr:hypothetical protein [Telluribacter sp. SYSU D00476]